MRYGVREGFQIGVGRGELGGLLALAFLQNGVLDAQAADIEGAADDGQDRVELEGFEHVVQGADLHGGHGRIDRAVPRHDYSGDIRVDGAGRPHELDAIEVRHHQVGQQQLVRSRSQIAERLPRGAVSRRSVALDL